MHKVRAPYNNRAIRVRWTQVTGRRSWEKAFLQALEKTGSIVDAAAIARINRRTIWQHRKADARFAELFEASLHAGALLLEGEAIRRAMEGVERIKFNPKTGEPYKDPRTGGPYIEREYSDQLLALLLKRHFAEYRDTQTTFSSVTTNVVTLSPQQRRDILDATRRALGDSGGSGENGSNNNVDAREVATGADTAGGENSESESANV